MEINTLGPVGDSELRGALAAHHCPAEVTFSGTVFRYTPPPCGAAVRQAEGVQEAAVLAGVRLQQIQNAITDRRLGRGFARTQHGRRTIDLPAVLTFALQKQLGKVRVEPKALYVALRRSGIPRAPIAVTEAVTIDAPRLLGPVIKKIETYDVARERIISDPNVMGGLPVVKGTRVPARTLHARVKGGDSIDSILEEYNYLDRDAVEAAYLFVEANPTRGRPKRRRPATRA